MPQIIDGKQIAMQIKEELKERVARLKQEGKSVCLAVIQVGNDPASTVYVNGKRKIVLISGSNRVLTSCQKKRKRKNFSHCSIN